jgi:hypothetical protein
VTVDMHLPQGEVTAILMEAYVIFTGHEEDTTDQCTRKRIQRGRRWAQVSTHHDLHTGLLPPSQSASTQSPVCACLCSHINAHVTDLLCRYYDVKVGGGQTAKVGDRVAVHYEARWKGVTFMTSRFIYLIIYVLFIHLFI